MRLVISVITHSRLSRKLSRALTIIQLLKALRLVHQEAATAAAASAIAAHFDQATNKLKVKD